MVREFVGGPLDGEIRDLHESEDKVYRFAMYESIPITAMPDETNEMTCPNLHIWYGEYRSKRGVMLWEGEFDG